MVQIDRSIYSHGTNRRSQRSGAVKPRAARAASGAPLTPHSWGEALFYERGTPEAYSRGVVSTANPDEVFFFFFITFNPNVVRYKRL